MHLLSEGDLKRFSRALTMDTLLLRQCCPAARIHTGSGISILGWKLDSSLLLGGNLDVFLFFSILWGLLYYYGEGLEKAWGGSSFWGKLPHAPPLGLISRS